MEGGGLDGTGTWVPFELGAEEGAGGAVGG